MPQKNPERKAELPEEITRRNGDQDQRERKATYDALYKDAKTIMQQSLVTTRTSFNMFDGFLSYDTAIKLIRSVQCLPIQFGVSDVDSPFLLL